MCSPLNVVNAIWSETLGGGAMQNVYIVYTVQCTSVHCAMQGRVESGRSEDSWTPWIHPWMDAARHSGQRLEGGWSSGFGSALVMLVMVEMIMFPVRHFKEVLFVNLLRKRQTVQSLVAVGEVRQKEWENIHGQWTKVLTTTVMAMTRRLLAKCWWQNRRPGLAREQL